METLGALTDEIRRDINHQWAVRLGNDSIDLQRPRRFISGVAVSSSEPNERGMGMHAGGAQLWLPVPLLWNHDYQQPIGLVTMAEAHAQELRFRAEVSNNGAHEWIERAWRRINTRFASCVSIGAINLHPDMLWMSVSKWRLNEISVLPRGADPGAKIFRCWEESPVVRLGAPSVVTHWAREDMRCVVKL
jgi:hypothetical protein